MMFLFWMTAWSGNPCPIDVTLTEMTPEWRNRAADLAALKETRTSYGLTWKDMGAQARITSLIPGTAASDVLSPGDIVVWVDGHPLVAEGQLAIAFDAANHGPMRFGVLRDGKRVDVTVQPSTVDPLVWKLHERLVQAECRTSAPTRLDPARQPDANQAVFTKERGFRCTDAHTRFNDDYPPGTLLMVRGGTRVLMTIPGFATQCLTVAATDMNVDEGQVDHWLEKVTDSYVKDRHLNP